jgi:hypothetical protein
MARHKGRPSGTRNIEGTGIPQKINLRDSERENGPDNEYLDSTKKLTGKIAPQHPNRNVNKGKATNAGGYRQ